MRTVFGVRICSKCPDCECANAFGSVARPTGGVIGMLDAYDGSVEAQKEGALHLHCSMFVASKWQHTPLNEIAAEIASGHSELVTKLLDYKHFVSREATLLPTALGIGNFARVEEQLKTSWAGEGLQLTAGPELSEHDTLAEWQNKFASDTNGIISIVQHHIHPRGSNGQRNLMRGCAQVAHRKRPASEQAAEARPAKRSRVEECRSGFYRTPLECGVVICDGLARRYGLPTSGKRSAIGTVCGPRQQTVEEGASIG